MICSVHVVAALDEYAEYPVLEGILTKMLPFGPIVLIDCFDGPATHKTFAKAFALPLVSVMSTCEAVAFVPNGAALTIVVATVPVPTPMETQSE